MEFCFRRFSCDDLTFLAGGTLNSSRVGIRLIFKCEKTWKSFEVFQNRYHEIMAGLSGNFVENVDLVCNHRQIVLNIYIT